jgi:hypothetical protein
VSDLGTQNDEGLHIAVAERLAAGDVLYRDLFENRTPGVELVLAAAFRVAEPSILLGRFLSLGAVAITLAALVLSGRLSEKMTWAGEGRQRGQPNMAGWAAGLLFGLAPLAIFWSRFTMLEHWQTAAATLAIATALLAVKRNDLLWWLVSGLLAGLAILAKQTGLVVAGVLVLYLLVLQLRPVIGKPRRALAFWLAGLAAPVVIFLIWLTLSGALDDFFQLLSTADRLAPLSGLADKVQSLVDWMTQRPVFLLGLVGALTVVRSRRVTAWLPLLWAAAETAVLFGPPQLDFGWGGFSHYALPALAALSLLGGIGARQVVLWMTGQREQKALAAAILALLFAMASGWLTDLNFAIAGSDYPGSTMEEEERIGRAAAALTDEDEPILVLGNAVFYHQASRRPANRFIDLARYLPESQLWPEAEADLLAALNGGQLGAVVVSRQYLEERVSEAMHDSLWREWVPAASFEYPYQRGVFLYLPRPIAPSANDELMAIFEPDIGLMDVEMVNMDDTGILVGLWWMAESPPKAELVPFVHLLDANDELVAQHDAPPAVGFRPTLTWQAGEPILDWHWIELPVEYDPTSHSMRIGLYDAVTGERRLLIGEDNEGDSLLVHPVGKDQ